MNFFINSIKSLSKAAKIIWFGSLIVICLSFFLFENTDFLTLVASLIGATSLIFAAKVNFNYLGMVICFTIFLVNDVYGFIQWSKSKKRQNIKI
ncbi:MAG: hypothetical protein LBM41_04370 [Ruminococcus sp.]|jgi:hypothetical protein|nr:hypothetical protein [Ruminococcus sp.]